MKRFIAIILALVIAISLMGCSNVEESNDKYLRDVLEGLNFTVLDHVGKTTGHDYYIVYDNETTVIYYLGFGYSQNITLCPRYDENGEVMIYGGE